MSLADTFVAVHADMRTFGPELQAGVRRHTSAAERAAGSTGDSMGKSMAKRAALAFGGLFALGKIKDILTDSVQGASAVAEAQSKVGVVFKDSSGQIIKASESSAEALGLSKRAYLESTGTIGNLFVALGLVPSKAADMSQSMVKLAGDLASFNNENPEDVMEALRSGLVGETEPMRRFGVNLNETTIKAEAMRLGLVKASKDTDKIGIAQKRASLAQDAYNKAVKEHGKNSTEARRAQVAMEAAQQTLNKAMKGSVPDLNAAQKAQAAYSLILSQTKTAQGDFARTSAGLANQQRIANARWEDAKNLLGVQLLPVVTKVTSAFSDFVDGMTNGTGAGGAFIAVIRNVSRFIWDNKRAVGALAAVMGALFLITKLHTAYLAVQAVGGLTAYLMTTKAVSAATRVWTAVQWLMNAALSGNPIGLVIALIAALAGGIIYAYKHSETFRKIVDATWKGIAAGAKWMWEKVLRPTFVFLTRAWMTVAGAIVNGAAWAFGWVPGLGPKLKTAAAKFNEFKNAVNKSLAAMDNRSLVVKTSFTTPQLNSISAANKRAAQDFQRGAKGGPVRGGTPGTDSVPYLLMPDEFIVRRDGSNLSDAMRHFGVRGMARGGVVPRTMLPTRPQIDAVNDRGWVNNIIRNASAIKGLVERAMAPLAAGIYSGPGGGGNVLARVRPLLTGGLYVTNTYRSPAHNAAVGGSPTSLHMDRRNPAVDIAGPVGALDMLAARLRSMGGWRELLWRVAGHYDHLHVADTGGLLRPGHMGLNAGTGVERILSQRQTESFDRLVTLLEGGGPGGGSPRTLVIVDKDGDLIGRMRVEAGDVLDDELQAARWGDS